MPIFTNPHISTKQQKKCIDDLLESRKIALRTVVDNGDDPNDAHIARLERQFKSDKHVLDCIPEALQPSLFRRVFSGAIFFAQREGLGNTLAYNRLSLLASDYKYTTESRLSYAELSEVAFMNEKENPSELLRSSAISTEWNVQVKLLNVTNSAVWAVLEYNEIEALDWWEKQKSIIRFPETRQWADMKALSKAVVFLGDDVARTSERKRQKTEVSANKFIRPIFDSLRVFMMKIIHLLCAFPDYSNNIAQLFSHAIPVVFLASNVIGKLRQSMTSTKRVTLSHYERKFSALDALIRILISKSQCLGNRIAKEQAIEATSLVDYGDHLVPSEGQTNTSDEAQKFSLETVETGLAKDEREAMSFFAELQMMQAQQTEQLCPTSSASLHPRNERALKLNGIEEIRISAMRGPLLGSGTYSLVYQRASPDGRNWYAVKEPVVVGNEATTCNRVGREAAIWKQLRHKNIHPLRGYCFLQDIKFPALVMDICHTNLSDLVLSCTEISEIERLKLLHDVSEGLRYLHSQGFGHGDLRANNVLVKRDEKEGNFLAALCDFGVSYCLASQENPCLDQFKSTAGQVGNPSWLALELIEKDAKNKDGVPSDGYMACVSAPGDMYAFGCVFLEVIFNRVPYKNEPPSMIGIRKREGVLPATLEQTNKHYFPFLSKLWSNDVDLRPSANDAAEQLLKYLRALTMS